MPENPADIAEEVVQARRRGYTRATVNGVVFNAEERGWCSRFVRLCHLAAGLPTEVFACCAHSTAQHLAGQQRGTGNPGRGDIVTFRLDSPKCSICGQPVWHIAILDGDGRVYENTSSGSRGNPRPAGTKQTPLSEIGHSRITGYYSLQAPLAEHPYRDRDIIVKLADRPFPGVLRGGVSYLGNDQGPPVRVLEQIGGAVYDHIPDQGTVYVYKRRNDE